MKFQSAEAIAKAAENPSGMAGMGAGMGAGFAMANQMAGAMSASGAAQSVTPPPLPVGNSFFVAIDGQQQGPIDMNNLFTRVQSGQIKRETLVWKQGLPKWIRADEVAELKALFDAVPPPLPK
jgi:hypothetical protein